MTNAVAALLFTCLLCLSAVAQDGGVGGRQSLGVSTSYSPNSSHIFIGQAEQRRTWTLGVEYSRRLADNRFLQFDYEAALLPLYLESDPTVIGTVTVIDGLSVVSPQTPQRVIYVERGPVGLTTAGNGKTSPIYVLYGRQNTYATEVAPLGARLRAFPRSMLQPSFAVDLGFAISSRDLPVDDSDRFNYMFSLGPSVQIFSTSRSSVRLDYIYRHLSNAHQGNVNPGVDQGVIRLTFSHYR